MKLARLDGSLAVNEDAPRGQGQQHLQASHTLNCGTWRGPAPEGGHGWEVQHRKEAVPLSQLPPDLQMEGLPQCRARLRMKTQNPWFKKPGERTQ